MTPKQSDRRTPAQGHPTAAQSNSDRDDTRRAQHCQATRAAVRAIVGAGRYDAEPIVEVLEDCYGTIWRIRVVGYRFSVTVPLQEGAR